MMRKRPFRNHFIGKLTLWQLFNVGLAEETRTDTFQKKPNQAKRDGETRVAATASTITEDMIFDERSKELYGEGQRFFDMIRVNRPITFNNDFMDVPVSRREKTIDRTFGGIVLPIDQDEINANPALKDQQNEYYK